MREHSFLEVNFSILAQNISLVQELSGQSSILPMIKADAYGHGLCAVGNFLSKDLNLKRLGVASLGEAKIFLAQNKDKGTEVWVFSDTNLDDQEARDFYSSQSCLPVIHQIEDLEKFLEDSKLSPKKIVIKLNTGMNRLGIDEQDWPKVVDLLKKFDRKEIFHLLTHFAYSWSPLKEGDKSHRQQENFEKALRFFKDSQIEIKETSMANSGAIEQSFATHYDWVRPGLMLYGPPSTERWKGEMISKLVTKVLKVFPVKRGTPIGYGINVAPADGWIAVLPLGYGDGLLTWYSGVNLMIQGQATKFFGRINMDMSFLFYQQQPRIKAGDMIELWGRDYSSVLNWCQEAQTIPYQLLCGLSSRLPRRYLLS